MALGKTIINGIVFAAGKSTRMATGRSKMLEIIEKDGKKKPMILYITDLLTSLVHKTIVLIGYDGTAVINVVSQYNKKGLISYLRVSKDDGSDLEPNTGGTIKKYAEEIAESLSDGGHFLFCVGDQPLMQIETLQDFINKHIQSKADASILLIEGNGMLEQSTSTGVSINSEGKMTFITPPKAESPTKGSLLIDVGVLLIKENVFLRAVQKLKKEEVFGNLLCNLPPGQDRINPVIATNPPQFKNINEKHELR